MPSYPKLGEFMAVFVPYLGYQVEVMICDVQHINATRIRRISMKHIARSILVKHTNSLSLWTVCILQIIIVESFFLAQFFWCERYMIINIEIIIIRRNPFKIPTHTLLVFAYFAI